MPRRTGMDGHRTRLTLTAALLPLAVACGAQLGDVPLHGTEWTVTAPSANGRAHLLFDQRTGKVTGRLGCNLVTASAAVRDARITLGTAATTRMMCDASLMHTEKRLLRLFGGTVKYRIDHRTLTLTSANGERVTAVAGP
ncbi:META domain-containing protein [Streptomyces sp. NPDC002758]